MGFFSKALKPITKPLQGILGLSDPYKAGAPYLNQIPGMGREYYKPFVDEGAAVRPGLKSQYESMMSNPAELINAMMGKYQQSPGYEFRKNQQLEAARNAAAAGGFAGTPFDAQRQMELVDAIAGQDIGSWLDRALGVQNRGVGGLEGIASRGFQASTGLGDYLGSAMGQQASAAMGGRSGQAGGQQGLLGNILGGLSYIAGSTGGIGNIFGK